MQLNIKSASLAFLLLFLSGLVIYFLLDVKKNNNSTLELVHVIFRHGEKNPDRDILFPTSRYYEEKYYPEGYGQLKNVGKKTMYNVGIELRERYDDFLGKTWNIKYLDARSTDYPRTKMSLQLVLAALYPPKGSDNWSPNYYWQPIPFDYVPRPRDKDFLAMFICSSYKTKINKIKQNPDVAKFLQRYDETLDILSEHANETVDMFRASFLTFGLIFQEEAGYPPDEWTSAVYPEPLRSLILDNYRLMTYSTEIKRIIVGYFMKKVLADTKAKIDASLVPAERKMFIYSGHEVNIATIILSIKALNLTHIPPYGAYILFEIHKIDGVYGIKLFYQNYEQRNPMAMKIPECDYFCPYEDFYNSLKDILPESDEECFGKRSNCD